MAEGNLPDWTLRCGASKARERHNEIMEVIASREPVILPASRQPMTYPDPKKEGER